MNDPLGQDVTPAVSAGVVTSTSVTHVVLPSELVCVLSLKHTPRRAVVAAWPRDARDD